MQTAGDLLTIFSVKWNSFFIILLFFLTVAVGEVDSDLSLRHPVHRRRTQVCIHGLVEEGKCICDQDFVGKHCEKKKHCATFRRYRNGSCTGCEEGYSGPFCEVVNCDHGQLNKMGTACLCDKPWNGTFCSSLSTNNVYSYYNKKAFLLGPLGALSIIPMCLTWFICEHMARKRQVNRVKMMMGGTIQEAVLKKMMTEGIDDV